MVYINYTWYFIFRHWILSILTFFYFFKGKSGIQEIPLSIYAYFHLPLYIVFIISYQFHKKHWSISYSSGRACGYYIWLCRLLWIFRESSLPIAKEIIFIVCTYKLVSIFVRNAQFRFNDHQMKPYDIDFTCEFQFVFDSIAMVSCNIVRSPITNHAVCGPKM